MEYRVIGRWLESQGVPAWFIVLFLDPVVIFLFAFFVRELLIWFLQRSEKTSKRIDLWRQISFYGAILLGIVAVGFEWRMAGLRWIGESLKLEMDSRHVVSNLEGAGNALISTALLVFILVLITRAYRFAVSKLAVWEENAGAIRFQRVILLTPRRIRQTTTLILRIGRLILVLTLLYLYFPLLLSFFPATAPFAGQIMPYVVGPFKQVGNAALGYIPKLITLLLILIVMRYLLRFLNFFFSALDKGEIRLPGFDAQWARSTYHLVRILVILVTVMIGYPYLPGSGTEVFKGFSVFVGAMVTLGGSASINHLISGLALTYGGAFRIGDKVKVGDRVLDVVDKGLMVTRFKSIQNEELSIPNASVLAQGVTNLTAAARKTGLAIRVGAGIGYDVDWRQVHSLMTGAAGKTPGILEDPAPFVLEAALMDYAVSYELFAFTDQVARYAHVSAELRRQVLDAFNQAGVEIMTPAVHALRDASQPAIPKDFLPRPLDPRGIRIETMGE